MHEQLQPKNMKRPLGRPRCKWQNDIRADLEEPVWRGFNCLRMEFSGRTVLT
jgi:hypothetical protein